MYNTIGIMGAMPEEISNVCANLTNEKKTELGGNTFFEGEFNGRHIVIVCAGMGKANAAAATQLLISKFNANAIIFSGIAGNMTSKISVGDVVVGDEIVYHDAQDDMFSQSYPHLKVFKSDKQMVAAASVACEKEGVKHIVGRIATGDVFVGDSATKAAIAQKCNPDCVEMEGAAVAHIASKNDVPFLILRAMSDDSDENAHEALVGKPFDISEYCTTAAGITMRIIDNI